MNINNFPSSIEMLYGQNIYFYLFILIDLILKGFALWKSARLKEKNWFWAILLINSMGILPTGYLILKRNVKVD